ncbi:MAG: hypothetical protein AB8B93_13465 [Pseudomonadales bacterium]
MIRAERGYAYVEILLAVSLLAISLAPMLESLANGLRQQRLQADYEAAALRAQSRLQTLQAISFATLSSEALSVGDPAIASGYSDPTSLDPRVLVFLSLYDHDNADADSDPFTGGDADLLWMRVATERGDIDYQILRGDL